MFGCIIHNPARGASALNKLKNLLVYLRDYKNEELKAMFAEESPISVPIIFNLLKRIMEIHRIIKSFIKTYINQCYDNNPIGNAHVYPYLCSLGDVVDVIAYRYLKLFLHKYKYTPGMEKYLGSIRQEEEFHRISRKGCKTQNFNSALQDKLGVNLEVSHLVNADNSECPICSDSLDANSDFAVLDACNHLMCTDCAEVTLMGKVVDLVPLYEESDDDDDAEYSHLVELGKIPKCPCCRQEVGQWTTTHIMKFCEENKCDYWEVNTKNPREYVPFFDAFPECIDECLLINYSAIFVWRAVHNDLSMKLKIFHDDPCSIFRNFSDVVPVIEKLLELPRAEKSSLKYNIETKNMLRVVNIIKRMAFIRNMENNAFFQQILADIKSKL